MTHEQWSEILRKHYAADSIDDEEGPPIAGRIPFLAARFPLPQTDGLTPDEREEVLIRWRAEVVAFMESADRAPAAQSVSPRTHTQPTHADGR
jgi:hypothetical protein